MKTFSQMCTEQLEEGRAIADERLHVHDRHVQLIVELDAKGIVPVSEVVRDDYRKMLLEVADSVTFCNVACDTCGTELVVDHTSQLLSYPPQRYIACIGCGWRSSTSRIS